MLPGLLDILRDLTPVRLGAVSIPVPTVFRFFPVTTFLAVLSGGGAVGLGGGSGLGLGGLPIHMASSPVQC